ncbi:MAG: hypothetical protein M1836_007906 [Candelina mexicana]|nr:MAG: hypothetical protein M1836_007906 [Candelina mexicana]
MAYLINIPNELVHEIFSVLHPSSIVDFACTCKHIHAVAPTILQQHKARMQKYYEVNDWYPDTIASTLLEVLTDPWLAWYIRRLVIFVHRGNWEEWQTRDDTHQTRPVPIIDGNTTYCSKYLSKPFRTLLWEALKDLPLVDDPNSFMQTIEAGNDLPLKCILLSRLSNIETLVVTAYEAFSNDNIVRWLSGSLALVAQMPKTIRPGWYQSLSKIYLNHETWMQTSTGAGVAFSTADWASFLALPSIGLLEVRKCPHANIVARRPCEIEPRSSPLQHLKLGRPHVTRSDVTNILRGVRALKSFSFEWQEFSIEPNDDHTEAVDAVLIGEHCKTLEELSFPKLNYEYRIGSLRGFEVLRQLSLNAWHLFDRDETTEVMSIVNLSHYMPASLEILKLTASNYAPHQCQAISRVQGELLSKALVAFVHAKDQYNPALKAICTRGIVLPWKNEVRPHLLSHELSAACNMAGVEYSDFQLEVCSVCAPDQHVLRRELDWVEAPCALGYIDTEADGRVIWGTYEEWVRSMYRISGFESH